MALSGDAQAVYQDPNPAFIDDTSWRGSGDSMVPIANPDYIHPATLSWQELTAAPVDSPFSSQNAIGTPEYSQDISGYLNALSPSQLLSLGSDFNISGLARTDLTGMAGSERGSLLYSPEDLRTLSKYRNVGGGWSLGDLGSAFIPYDDVTNLNEQNNPAQLQAPLWHTRNYADGIDDLYRYDDGNFRRASENEPGHTSAVTPYMDVFKAAVLAYMGGVVGGGLVGAAGNALGGATTAAGTGAAGSTAGGLASSPSFSLLSGPGSLYGSAATTPGGIALGGSAIGAGAGSTASLISGAGSLAGSLPAWAAGASDLSSTAGMGSNALLDSPNFSLIDGPGSLNLGLADRWELPDNLKSIDLSPDYGDLARKGIKFAADQFLGGGAPQQTYQQSGGGGGYGGGGFSPVEYEAANALPYQQYRLPERQNTLGYIDKLRSPTWPQ
jgi:hypothetical protein